MMLRHIESFTDDEMALVLYVVNVLFPPGAPKIEFGPEHLRWFRHEAVIKKLVDALPHIKPEAHPIYVSLMGKLGAEVDLSK